nr:M1 family aminopeptidase [Kibdelosporangium sp. MJ126-NF4]
MSRRKVMAATAALLFVPMTKATAEERGAPADDGLNLRHHAVNLNYRPESDTLAGVTTIVGTATRKLSSFDLNFLLTVTSVSVNNEPAAFTSRNGKLTITPKKPIAGDLLVVVRYRDTPGKYPGGVGRGWGWKRTPTGALAVAAAPSWYPTAFDQGDKATLDVSIVVPTGLQAVSNGALQYGGPLPVPGGDQWSWRGEVAQSSGLSLLAIGQYDLRTSTGPDGKQVVTAYGKDLGALDAPARASVERTPEIVLALSNWFGPYPYAALGGVVDKAFFNVVATTTRPIYDGDYFQGGANASMVAHENAHQWYGNAVNPVDQWLSEGFASYAEFLWSELEGLGTATELAQYYYDQFPAGHEAWAQPPANPDPESNLAFPIYTRGALALQALRTKVGDETFVRILRTWVTDQKTEAATTAEFVEHAERVAGTGLTDVFQPWIYAAERPAVGPNGPAVARYAAKPKSYDTITGNRDRLASSQH